MADNMTGKVFNNRYEIIDRIGLGGMAAVYRARDNVLDRIVAVKVMLPQFAADETFKKRFRQEAASAAAMQSPYIVSIYDWGEDNGTYYIVMEYVRGSDLKTGINERGAINQRKVAEIGSQVAQALSVAHSHEIIHRDIKPQNIMIQPDGNAKVMDFGIARAKGAGLTQTSSVLGTAHYISPEQAQGKELSPASDIYSLGIVMYEAATGQLPFDGPDAVSVALKQVSEMPTPPHVIKPDIDPALEGIIMHALSKDPSARFSSAKEMRKALNDYLAGRPVSGAYNMSQQPTAVYNPGATQVVPPVRTNTNVRQQGISSTEEETKSGKGKAIGIAVAIVVVIAIIAGVAYTLIGGSGETVPDVTGDTIAEATAELEKSGFRVGTVTRTYSETVEEGLVISQDPASGLKRDKNTTVNLVVSQGAESVTVPDLSGMTESEATAALSKAGLKGVKGTDVYSSTVEKGKVVSQSPSTGNTVSKGSSVEYVLSKGVETKSVPNVVNRTEESATSTLEDAGFTVAVQRGYSSEVSEGYVYQQTPTSGTKAESGSEITIYVSKGSEEITIPNVVGQTVANATANLQYSGFAVSIVGDSSSTAIVTSMYPSGTAVKGATITLYASGGNTNTNENSNTNTTN